MQMFFERNASVTDNSRYFANRNLRKGIKIRLETLVNFLGTTSKHDLWELSTGEVKC